MSEAEKPEQPASDTYAAGGVHLEEADEAVSRIASHVRSTYRPEVVGDIGGFGGLFALGKYDEPILVSSTDGVGTKIQLARELDCWDTIGIDLVAMCVDDLAVTGAEPLFFLDYVSCGRVVPARIEAVVAGVAVGCREVGAALIGGEIAEHPGVMDPDDLDLAGFAVGVVERAQVAGPDRVRPGDVVIGLLSPNLRSNGFSLVRRIVIERHRLDLRDMAWQGAEHSLGDELLAPSVLYSPVLREISRGPGFKAAAHITGGGIAANLARALPDSCDAVVLADSWTVPPVFGLLAQLGGVEEAEMARVFNLGLGMAMIVAPDAVDEVLTIGSSRAAWVVGEVGAGNGSVGIDGRFDFSATPQR